MLDRPQLRRAGRRWYGRPRIRALGAAADIIFFADLALADHQRERADMILDIEPVADIAPVAVDRQRFALERVENDERDELFRELIRPVVVRAVRYDRRQSVGMVPGADEMVAGRLAGRVGRTRIVGRRLGEKPVRPERAIDLVGRDWWKRKRSLASPFSVPTNRRGPLRAACGCRHVCRMNSAETGNRTIDVALGGEMHQRIGCKFGERRIDRAAVANIGAHKTVVRLVFDRGSDSRLAA